MAITELEKLADGERQEFLRLYHTSITELSPEDEERLGQFASIIDFQRYCFELKREEAKNPRELACTIISIKPYRFSTMYGELDLPEELVPSQLINPPAGDGYHKNYLFAQITADLDTRKITSFVFDSYLKKYTEEELAKVPGIESLPDGEWPIE